MAQNEEVSHVGERYLNEGTSYSELFDKSKQVPKRRERPSARWDEVLVDGTSTNRLREAIAKAPTAFDPHIDAHGGFEHRTCR